MSGPNLANTLQYSLTKYSPYPEFGFKAKVLGFLEANISNTVRSATPVQNFIINQQ
jgi:hypothetical protein